MAYPPGLSVARVSVGKSIDWWGDPVLSISATVTVLLGDAKYVTHKATGVTMVAASKTWNDNGTGELELLLPHVDQPGYVAPSGADATFWAYKVTVTVTPKDRVARVWEVTNFQPLMGQGVDEVIDLDLVVDGPGVPMVLGDIPAVLSVAGHTGHVTLADLDLGAGGGGGGAVYDDTEVRARLQSLEDAPDVVVPPPYDDTMIWARLEQIENAPDTPPYDDAGVLQRLTAIESAPAPTWANLTGKPTTFPPVAHAHPTADVTGLDTALAGKAATTHAHAYADITGKPATFAPSAHGHAIAEVTDLQAALDAKAAATHAHAWSAITSKPTTFAPSAHTHTAAQVTDLQPLLDAKAPATHGHAIAEVTGLQAALDSKAAAGSGGATYDDTALKGRVATLEAKPAPTWAEVTGKPSTFAPATHAHAYADITAKPTTFPPAAHAHTTADVTGLDTALTGKAAATHTHAIADTTGLQATLDTKAPTTHAHAYADITGKPSTFAPSTHTHTTAQVTGLDTALASKAATTHAHPTSDITGLDTALAGKAATTHAHAYADITGKPATFPPSAHGHALADTTGLQAALDAKAPTAMVPALTATPFLIGYAGSAWPYTTLAAAQAAGLNSAQRVWFTGPTGVQPPSWARAGDIWAEGV